MNGDTGEGAASNRTPVDIGEGSVKPSPGDSEGKEGENATFKAPQSTSGKEEEGFVKVTNRKQRSSSSGNSGAGYGVKLKDRHLKALKEGPKRQQGKEAPTTGQGAGWGCSMREIVRPSCCIFMDIRVFDIYFLSMDYEQNFNLKLVSVG